MTGTPLVNRRLGGGSYYLNLFASCGVACAAGIGFFIAKFVFGATYLANVVLLAGFGYSLGVLAGVVVAVSGYAAWFFGREAYVKHASQKA